MDTLTDVFHGLRDGVGVQYMSLIRTLWAGFLFGKGTVKCQQLVFGCIAIHTCGNLPAGYFQILLCHTDVTLGLCTLCTSDDHGYYCANCVQ